MKFKIIYRCLLFFISCFLSIAHAKTLLITGGDGYIGSAVTYHLNKQGYKVIILSRKGANSKKMNKWATCIRGDFADVELLKNIFTQNNIEAVIHLAASTNARDSMNSPLDYYINNISKTLVLLKEMLEYNVNKLIFASSCFVYGNVYTGLITEECNLNPISPYGYTKVVIENILKDLDQAKKLRYVILRYSNVAGACLKENVFKDSNPKHLVPILIKTILNQDTFNLYGNAYNTYDGTCIRDYIHVDDVAQAHSYALEYLNNKGSSQTFNLGSGTGTSIQELITMVEKITGKKLSVNVHSSRIGDPNVVVANIDKVKRILKWEPSHSDIQTIVKSIYNNWTSS